jgi:hypothetical protein
MAEPLHQGEIITIRPITISNNTMPSGAKWLNPWRE